MKTQIKSERLTVTINSSGAEISSVKNNEGLEFIWQAKADVWPRHAPVLFPIVGKLKNNSFTIKNTPYQLGQHGFARDNEFTLLTNTGNTCIFEFRSSPDTKQLYPFGFILRISYELMANKLITTYTVINPEDSDLFFSIGAHPGFNCPLNEGERFEDYFLELETEHLNLSPLKDGLRTGKKTRMVLQDKKLRLSATLFDNDALVFENRQISAINLRSDTSSHLIRLECTGWPYFGIWSKKGCKEFICLEPWYGIADSEQATGNLSEKEGIIRLSPGKEFECSFTLGFD